MTGNTNKLVFKLYKYVLNLSNFEYKWINYVRQSLQYCEKMECWYNKFQSCNITLKYQIRQTLIDRNIQLEQNYGNQTRHKTSQFTKNIFK